MTVGEHKARIAHIKRDIIKRMERDLSQKDLEEARGKPGNLDRIPIETLIEYYEDCMAIYQDNSTS